MIKKEPLSDGLRFLHSKVAIMESIAANYCPNAEDNSKKDKSYHLLLHGKVYLPTHQFHLLIIMMSGWLFQVRWT